MAIVRNNATISSTAQTLEDIGFTSDQVRLASRLWIALDGGDLRYDFSGDAPTASVGLLFFDENTYEIEFHQGGSPAGLQMIRRSADVNVTCELLTHG